MTTASVLSPELVSRKQSLEKLLKQKTEELRALCLREAVSYSIIHGYVVFSVSHSVIIFCISLRVVRDKTGFQPVPGLMNDDGCSYQLTTES